MYNFEFPHSGFPHSQDKRGGMSKSFCRFFYLVFLYTLDYTTISIIIEEIIKLETFATLLKCTYFKILIIGVQLNIKLIFKSGIILGGKRLPIQQHWKSLLFVTEIACLPLKFLRKKAFNVDYCQNQKKCQENQLGFRFCLGPRFLDFWVVICMFHQSCNLLEWQDDGFLRHLLS